MAAPWRDKRINEMGITELRCFCDRHSGMWLPEDSFGFTRYLVRSTGERKPIKLARCKESYMLDRRKRRDPCKVNAGRLPISQIRPYIERIIVICGGYNAAARTIGVSQPTIYKWMGRYSGYKFRYIYKTSAEKILVTLVGLQDGTIQPAIANKIGGRVFKYGCRSCGADLDNYTVGCHSCTTRRDKRTIRERDAA